MSRLGKKPISIPEKTEVSVTRNIVVVKGPYGVLERSFDNLIKVEVFNRDLKLTPMRHSKLARALWGTYAAHIANMLKGVNRPFEKRLIVEGIGYKAEVKGSELVLNVGFSHTVKIPIPKELEVKAEKNIITVTGADKELVGEFASRTRSVRKPEPYKGKGIRYSDEVIRRKQGKKTT